MEVSNNTSVREQKWENPQNNCVFPVYYTKQAPFITFMVRAKRRAKIKQIQGIKQSGGDIHGLADMIRAVGPKMPILTAIDDMIFPSFIIGANGAIAAINTVTPELCIQAWEAARDNDTKTGVEIHHRLLPLWRTIGKGDMPSRAKEALKQLGRPVGPARSPLINVNDLVKKEIHNALKEAKLIK